MFTSPNSIRRMLAVTTALTVALPGFPLSASAQDAAPPARVGQIATVSGNVSFNGASTGGWAAASVNYPVSEGDTLYTQNGAQAAIALDASRISLAGNTELQVTAINDEAFNATESQGEIFLNVDDLQQGQQYTISTPQGSVNINQNGQYEITAGDANSPMVVAAYQGAASVNGPGGAVQVPAGQEAVLNGSGAQLGQAQPDAFASAMLAQSAPPPPPYVPPVVGQMTGSYELSNYGSWNQNPQYGAVWYPYVSPGWAPYRQGHWANVAPWGWTWVESEPWGFAPFHYGRWVDFGGRWGWAPAYSGGDYGASYQPVYAPAVVSFFGLGLAAGITVAALSSGSIGWVPLAPNEPYYPSYRCPPDYIRRINVVNVRNINIVNIHNTNNYYGQGFSPNQFANRHAATYIPAEAMTRGDPVAHYGHPVTPDMFANARSVQPGFAVHPPAGQPAAYRLPPPGMPMAQQRPGLAPRPYQPAAPGRPPGTAEFNTPHVQQMPPQEAGRPPVPEYHPEQPAMAPVHPQETARPPMPEVHYGQPSMAQPYHPQEEARPPVPQYHPEQPSMAQPYHPQEQTRPPEPQFHAQEPQFHPQEMPQFHPQPMEQPRPVEMPHPVEQPHPMAEPPHSAKHPQ